MKINGKSMKINDNAWLQAAGCWLHQQPQATTSHQPPAPPISQQPAAWIQGSAAVAVASKFIRNLYENCEKINKN